MMQRHDKNWSSVNKKIEFVVLIGDEGQASAPFSHWLTGLQSHPPTSCHYTSYVVGQSTKGMMTGPLLWLC